MLGKTVFYTVITVGIGAFLIAFGPIILLSLGLSGLGDLEPEAPLNTKSTVGEELSIAAPTWALRPGCELPSRPSNARIHAVTLAKGGIETPAQAFGTRAFQVNVDITDTSGPVYLMLSARNAAIWNIRTAPKVIVGGVVTTGFDHQIVVTRQARAAMLPATTADRRCRNVFREMRPNAINAVSEEELAEISVRAYGRAPDNIIKKTIADHIVIGPEEDVVKLPAVTDPIAIPDILVDTHRPILFGRPALARLVKEGVLSQATEADIAKWKSSGPLSPNVPDYLADPDLTRFYVVQRPFRLPLGLTGEASAAFIIPAGMKEPDGWIGENVYLKYSPFGCGQRDVWHSKCNRKDFGSFIGVATPFKSVTP